jgi:TolB protein
VSRMHRPTIHPGFALLYGIVMLATPVATRGPGEPTEHPLNVAPSGSQEEANDEFLLFTSDRHRPSNAGICEDCEDIYVMSPDGTSPIRLTHGGGDVNVPGQYSSNGADWSRSQELIAFNSNRDGGIPQIFLMNADGSDERPLGHVDGGAAFPSFSHNGKKLCFHSFAEPRDIYTVKINGTGLKNLTRGQLPVGNHIRCDWSPNGDQIAFTSNRDGDNDIYVINADGSGLVQLTNTPRADANPAWSPTGDHIAFESNRSESVKPEIYVMNADGSFPIRLTNFDLEPTPSFRAVTKPTWSPTGDRIAFHRRVGEEGKDGHLEVYTIGAGGGIATRVTETEDPGSSGFPSWGAWPEPR